MTDPMRTAVTAAQTPAAAQAAATPHVVEPAAGLIADPAAAADTAADRQTRGGRRTRDEDVEVVRRRRKSQEGVDPTLSRFGITADILDHKKYVYRAALDDGMRIHQLTVADDYDFVTIKGEIATQADAEGVVKYRAGTKVDGSPQFSYLLQKLKQFADEDRGERSRKVEAQLKARLTKTPDDAPDRSYTPGKG